MDRPFKIPGLWLHDSAGAVKIDPGSIAYCHHHGNVTKIVYASGHCTIVQISLTRLEKKLGGKFFRCHRNYLVNLDQIMVGSLDDQVLKFPRRRRVPVARRRKQRLIMMLDPYNL